MELKQFVASTKSSSIDISRYCNIKTYLTVQEKIDFMQKYYQVLNEKLSDNKYDGAEDLIAFVIFNLMSVQTYTDIEFDLSFEAMDLLQRNGLINKIIGKIGEDYKMLVEFIRL